MTDDVNRHLLFGLIALQVGLIDQARLAAAFQAWTGDKARSLADYLADRGDLDADGRAAIEAIVALHVKKHGGNTEESLASIPASRSIREQLATLGDPELTCTVAHLGLGSTETDADRSNHHQPVTFADPGPAGTIAHPAFGPTETGAERTGTNFFGTATADGQRFRVLRLHARGGLGAVFVALDGELHREVALKQILDSHADDPVSRQRFLLEAEITGGLEHPGIVPVYGLGTDGDGRPYYAMRFVSGDSLKEVIDRFHKDKALKTDPGRRSLELRKLLGRFIDACNAIDFAHSRGVLHRDIKPANVIVGKHGETLVVDWGLAKPLGRVEPDLHPGERPLFASAAGGSTETLPGSALGTPAYMSPEQADGDLERLGPASDVYSLGASLYCLLTGMPPFEGNDIGAVLGAVKTGEFVKPRKVAPSIDKALEAVCLKAMAMKPEDRYATPRALADDIEHWLADEPVKAYPDQPPERLGRWLRQHRTWTYAAVAALIGISLAASIGVVVVDGARRREAVVRKEAETNFIAAQRAVDDYLTSVSENTLLKQQDSVDTRSLRQELLNSALTYYKSFVNQRGDDPRVRHQLANAYYRVGQITQEIGSVGEAISAYRSALALWEPLADAEPQNDELRGRLADCHRAIGNLQASTDDFRAAMASVARASTIFERLTKAHPETAAYQASLAQCTMRIGIFQGQLMATDQARTTLEKAKTIQEHVIAQVPGRSADQIMLAEIILTIGTNHYDRHDYPAALESFREALRICRSVLDGITAGPKPVRLLDLLAITHYNVATIQRKNGRVEEALQSFERSLEYRSALADAHPSVTHYQEQLGKNWGEIALLQHDASQDDKALASIKRSIEVLVKLVQAQPDQPRYQHDLGRSWNILGFLHDEARRNDSAIPAFDRAIAEQMRAVTAAPENDLYKLELISQLDNLGEEYVDLGKVGEGLPHYRREIVLWRELLAARPGNQEYALKLAEALSKLGNIQRHSGDSTAARESFVDARSLLEHSAAATSGDGAVQVRLGAALVREASALADLGEPDKARALLDRAVKTLSDAVVSSADEAQRRESLSEALWELARILLALKNPVEADRVDAQRVTLWQGRRPGELATLALKQTSLAALIGYGKTPVPPAALSVRKLDLDQAAANLKLAIARGFRNLPTLQSHPDSPILLSREDVKLLIMDMAFPDRPFADK